MTSRHRRRTRTLFVGLVALLGAACGATATAPPADTTPGEDEEEDESPPAVATPVVVALRFGEAEPTDDSDVPRTRIVLVVIDPDAGRSTTEVGTYQGACTPARAPEGIFLAAACWWGPNGSEVWVAHESDTLVIRQRIGDEPSSEVARIELPEDAELEAMGP